MFEAPLPLTAQQQKMYTYHRLYPGDPGLNGPLVYEITGDIEAPRLAAAMERVLRASKGLNLTFVQTATGAAGIDNRWRRYVVPLIELSGDAAADEQHVIEYVRRVADTPMSPECWPLYDVRLWHRPGVTYLGVVFSHMVCDATGLWSMFDTVSQAYAGSAEIEGRLAALADVPADCGTEGAVIGEATEFFRSQFAAVPEFSETTLSAPRRADGAMLGQVVEDRAAPSLTGRIRVALDKYQVSPFAFHLAAYAVLLSKLTGSRQVVAGIPLANRRGARARRVVGHFVNTLPLCVDLTGFRSYAQLCRSLQRATLRLLRYQDFDLAAHAAQLFGDGRAPLPGVNNAFTYYKRQLGLALSCCSVRRLSVPRNFIKYGLSMAVENNDDTLTFQADVAPGLAPAQPVKLYQHLLTQVAADFDTPLSALAALDAAGKRRIDELLNRRRAVAAPPTITARFDEVAREHADRIAVEDDRTKITYGQLADRANRVACWLQRHLDGDYLGVCGPRRVDLVVGTLAALKAGKTYVPIDPASPAVRLRRIMSQFMSLPLLLTGEVGLDVADARCILLDEVLAASTDSGTPLGAARDGVAYVLFTSGSTGDPKGVEIPHATLPRLFAATRDLFGFDATDTWSMLHSHAFDFSVWEMFGALLNGARLVVVPQQTVASPAELAELLITKGVTVLNQTPSAFNQLLTALAGRGGDDLAVRLLFVGGEAVRFSALAPWFAMRGNACRVFDIYGPTETSVWVTYHEITRHDVAGETGSVIGRPLPDVTAYLMDCDGQPAPVGAPGELLIGGAAVGRGYLNDPAATAAKYIKLPDSGERVYRTGDICVLRPDGSLVFQRRRDRQVQLRGYRIEPAEVEQALLAAPGVQGTAVRVLDAGSPRPRLVAYLVADPSVAIADLRRFVKERVPGYMVPSFFVRMPALPLTVNGKLDEAALPAPTTDAAALPTGGGMSGGGMSGDGMSDDGMSDSGVAVRVRKIWRATTGAGLIGLDDNFFDIGGTSMHLAEVYARLQAEFGLTDMRMVELFERPTLRTLSARIEEGLAARDGTSTVVGAPQVQARRARARTGRRLR